MLRGRIGYVIFRKVGKKTIVTGMLALDGT